MALGGRTQKKGLKSDSFRCVETEMEAQSCTGSEDLPEPPPSSSPTSFLWGHFLRWKSHHTVAAILKWTVPGAFSTFTVSCSYPSI